MSEQNNNISSPEATSDDLTRKSTLTRPDPSAIAVAQADPDSANRITPHQVSHAPVTLLIGNLTLSPRPLFDNKRKRIPSSPSYGHCSFSLTAHPYKKHVSFDVPLRLPPKPTAQPLLLQVSRVPFPTLPIDARPPPRPFGIREPFNLPPPLTDTWDLAVNNASAARKASLRADFVHNLIADQIFPIWATGAQPVSPHMLPVNRSEDYLSLVKQQSLQTPYLPQVDL